MSMSQPDGGSLRVSRAAAAVSSDQASGLLEDEFSKLWQIYSEHKAWVKSKKQDIDTLQKRLQSPDTEPRDKPRLGHSIRTRQHSLRSLNDSRRDLLEQIKTGRQKLKPVPPPFPCNPVSSAVSSLPAAPALATLRRTRCWAGSSG